MLHTYPTKKIVPVIKYMSNCSCTTYKIAVLRINELYCTPCMGKYLCSTQGIYNFLTVILTLLFICLSSRLIPSVNAVTANLVAP